MDILHSDTGSSYYDTIWYDVLWNNMAWYDAIRYNMKQYDMIVSVMKILILHDFEYQKQIV